MAGRQWYIAIDGETAGPYTDQQLGQMVGAGTVRADTFVWCNGMKDWVTAAEIQGLMPRARPTPPPPPRAAAPQPRQAAQPRRVAQTRQAAAHGSAPQPEAVRSFSLQDIRQAFSAQTPADAEALTADVAMWPLLGRVLLVAIAQITIVATPWVMPSFYRWFVERIELPGRQRLAFAGKPGDIWYIFILGALLPYFAYIIAYISLLIPFLWRFDRLLSWLSWPLTVLVMFLILRWIIRNLVSDGQPTALTFTGSYWGMLAWYVLTAISAITIVGWAWVGAAWMRWICAHIEGGDRQLVFSASGLEMLWRTVLFALSCIVIIPIPWTLQWYTRWLVSQFALSSEGTQPA